MLKRLGQTLAKFVGLIFTVLGLWVLVVNLVDVSYSGAILAWILASGVLGCAGGLLYLLSFDGPERLRTRRARIIGWVGMVALAMLPTSLSIPLLAMVLLVIPTLVTRSDEGEPEPSPSA